MFFLFLGAREPFDSPELEHFSHALDIVQRRYPALTIGQLSTLLRIGMTPAGLGQSVSVSDVVARSPRQKYPTIARQIDQLGEGTEKSMGLKLVEKDVDPEDRRNRYIAISAQGKQLLYELDLILTPDNRQDHRPNEIGKVDERK